MVKVQLATYILQRVANTLGVEEVAKLLVKVESSNLTFVNRIWNPLVWARLSSKLHLLMKLHG